jgi:hypothetical protein
MGPTDRDIGFGRLELEPGFASVVDRFLHEKDSTIRSKPGEQMLRSLIDEIPSQMRENNEVPRCGVPHDASPETDIATAELPTA